MVLTSPSAFELVQEFEIICPAFIAINEYLMCDILLTDGTNLQASIDYGDRTSQNFQPIGKFKLYK